MSTTQKKITACFLCPCNCGLEMTLDNSDRIVSVKGDKNNPRTKGFCCSKGRHQAAHIDSPHRLTTPLCRKGGRLVEISWEEAISGIADGLKNSVADHGARSVGMVVGGSPHPTLQFVIGFMFLRGLGSRNLFSPISLEYTSKYLVNQKMFGCSFFEGHPDFENSAYVLLIGTNPLVSHPLWTGPLKAVAKSPERSLVVIDPRRTETAAIADAHFTIRPGTDIFLLLSLLQVIITKGLFDSNVPQRMVGIEEVKKSVARFTPEAVAELTGIDAEHIYAMAKGLTDHKPSIIHYDMGVIGNHHSTLVSWAVKTLNLLTGSMGQKGGHLFNPTLLNRNDTETSSFKGTPYESRMRGFPEITGHMPVTVLQDEILTPGSGQIRSLIVNGANPLRSYTNADKMEKAFRDLDLLISIDPFLTEVGRLAHFVLPACSYYEQENVSFALHELYPTRFVQLTQPIRPPLGESRPEGQIYTDLSQAMGVPFMNNRFFHGLVRIGDTYQKLLGRKQRVDRQRFLTSALARKSGTSYKELCARPHGFDLPDKKGVTDMMGQIKWPDKRARLNSPKFLAAIDALEIADADLIKDEPFVLSTTCRTTGNVNTLYQNPKWLKEQKANFAVIHPKAAKKYLDGQHQVRIITRWGQVEAPVQLSEEIPKEMVYLSGGWGLTPRDPKNDTKEPLGAAATTLLPDDIADPFSGMPLLNGIGCRLEKVD